MTVVGSGTQTAIIGSEHTLQDTSAIGIYTFEVDTVNMAALDILELRVYKMVLTSGTRRVCYLERFTDAQPTDDLIKVSVPISTALTDSGALRFTLKQIAGTGRAYPWSVNSF
jgi:hypothetical protein